MEDTSFAIHPDNKAHINGNVFRSIGSLVTYHVEKNILHLQCEAAFVRIQFFCDDIVRIVMNPKEWPSLKSSFAVIKQPMDIPLTVSETEDEMAVKSGRLSLKITKAPLRITIFDHENRLLVKDSGIGMGYNSKKEVICFKGMEPDDHFYGFGEKTGFLDKRGDKLTMWNTDVYAPHNPEIDSLYQSIPFFMTLRNGFAHGIYFNNTFKTVFDLKTSQYSYSFSAEGGQLDYFVFVGPSPKQVIKQYTDITGRMPLPPKWALGYHQSRYSYQNEQEVRDLANQFLQKEIPLDAIYLDIHYMDGYRVFTFNQERFPNPAKLIADLKSDGIHVVTIVDPGVKADPEYQVYREGITEERFCKYLEGNQYFGEVWPGKSAFPDFTNSDVRKWWGDKHQFYTDLGIEGIWNDMNEPAIFNESKTMDLEVMHDNDGDPKTHRELHNLYGMLMGEATYEGMKEHLNGNRPFLVTRAGFAGVQRYSAVWTGDNRSFWEHLQMSLPMCMNLGVSGVAFCGPDVGGFAHDTTGQLLTRWTQVGMFTPFFRNHSVLESIHQEPWSFGSEFEKIIKKYIEQRYVWLPYLYTLFKEACVSGIPVMRPLMLEYPGDKNTFNLFDQFMIGADVLVAPILTPDTNYRVVYLPEGTWNNYWTDAKLEGGKHHLVDAGLDVMPIFVRSGAIIPQGTVKQSTEVKESELLIHLYPAENVESTFTYYEDDGKTFAYQNGEYFQCQFTMNLNGDNLELAIDILQAEYEPDWEKATFIIHGWLNGIKMTINGLAIGEMEQVTRWTLNKDQLFNKGEI
jgi:alpha-glucosidase